MSPIPTVDTKIRIPLERHDRMSKTKKRIGVKSINAFVNDAIEEKIQNEKRKNQCS